LKVDDVRPDLREKGNSNSHDARPVHLIITMIQWIRTSRLPIRNSLSLDDVLSDLRGMAPSQFENNYFT